MNLQTESDAMNKIGTFFNAKRQLLTAERQAEHHSFAMLMLDEHGYIRECDKSVEALFGYCQHELVWQHISCLFPELTEFALINRNRLNPLLNYICHWDYEYEAINRQSCIMKCNLDFILVEHQGVLGVRLIVRSVADSHS